MKGEREAFVEARDTFKKIGVESNLSDELGRIVRLNRRFVMMDISYLPFDVLFALDELFGPVSRTILFRTGLRWGDEIYARYEGLGFDRDTCLKLSAAGAWYFGWGIVAFELGSDQSKARIYNCFEAESLVKNRGVDHENSCSLFTGVIAGIYSRYLGKQCKIREEKCAARGDGYCELIATPGTGDVAKA
jgi:predicted hydrocarbon binding protein